MVLSNIACRTGHNAKYPDLSEDLVMVIELLVLQVDAGLHAEDCQLGLGSQQPALEVRLLPLDLALEILYLPSCLLHQVGAGLQASSTVLELKLSS